ncbi:MAG: helix-turn-helix transcriptional regulator [Oligoflexia bacterium]|nr:helix-turn-helix transcriptional regulator [Oligoflexia bacterium]
MNGFDIPVRSAAELGAALASLRKKKGLTQTKLAKLAMVRQSTISDFENGLKGNISTLFKLLVALAGEFHLRQRGVPINENRLDFMQMIGGLTSSASNNGVYRGKKKQSECP